MAEYMNVSASGKDPREFLFEITDGRVSIVLEKEVQPEFIETLEALKSTGAGNFRCAEGSLSMTLEQYDENTGDGTLKIFFQLGSLGNGRGTYSYQKVMGLANRVPAPTTA